MRHPTGRVRFTSINKIITIIAILSSILITTAKIVITITNLHHQAVFLVGNIAGSLIAFLAFVAFLNGVLSWYYRHVLTLNESLGDIQPLFLIEFSSG